MPQQEGMNFELDKNKEVVDYIIKKSKELGPEMIENYTHFHENPELGGEERETAKKVVDYLQELGVEILGQHIGSTGEKGKGEGVVARIKGQDGGSTVALRADMDALPVEESEENEPRSSQKGKMHGCGHDLHTTGLMGGAKILKELADQGKLEGDVLLLFQSSEEKTHQKESGAVQMIKFLEKNGLRKDIKAFFGLHVFSELERGKVQLKEGVQAASSGEMNIILTAPGGHIMNAYDAPNLNTIFAKITSALADKFKPMYEKKEALVASARTDFAGKGYNVLTNKGETTWVIRVVDSNHKEISKEIAKEIKNTVDEIVAKESGADKIGIEIKRNSGYRPVVNRDPELVKIASDSANEVISNYQQVPELLMGGEDFSFYSEEFRGQQIPGVFAMVGGNNPEKGYPKVGHHDKKFKVDPDVLEDLSSLYSNLAVKGIKHFNDQK